MRLISRSGLRNAGQVNARYGSGPGVIFYTHNSDRYASFHTKVINATMRNPRTQWTVLP